MLADIIVKVAGFEKEERGEYAPRPSLAGPERCIRQMVYWAMGTRQDKEMGDRFIMTLDDSSWHESLTADWIQKTAYRLHSEQMPVNINVRDFVDDGDWIATRKCGVCHEEIKEGFLHGHIDGIVTDALNEDYHYEHKALNHYRFLSIWEGELPLDYITQCCIYNRGIQSLVPGLRRSVLLIKNKNTAQYVDMVIDYDKINDIATIVSTAHSNGQSRTDNIIIQNIIGDAIKKLKSVHDMAKERGLPERPYEYGTNFPCGYCSYEDTCFQDYQKEFAEMENDVQLEGSAVELCSLYLEQVNYEKEIQQHKEELKKKIKQLLKDNNAKSGRAGQYIIQNRLVEQVRLMKKEDIPQSLLPQITRKTVSEILTVRKIKEEL